MLFQPNLLKFADGTSVSRAEQWPARREEILRILSENEFGCTPTVPSAGRGKIVSTDPKCCSGHAILEMIDMTVDTEKDPFTFPLHFFRPANAEKAPLILLVNFRPDIYDMYYPIEEIIDNGFAAAVICYTDVTSDDGDFTNGLAGHFTRPDDGTGFGKISLWAWAASRALDYFLTRPEIDPDHTAILGHSRLGKTALWCGAQDERFRYVFSNDSGCSGAALERILHEGRETIADITDRFPFWFCENYLKYVGKVNEMPFDQHFLLAASAPRYVCVGSAGRDLWADPVSEQLSCIAASPAWKLQGLSGYLGAEDPAAVGASYLEGSVGYQLRDGIHFLGRRDWQQYMAFIRLHW